MRVCLYSWKLVIEVVLGCGMMARRRIANDIGHAPSV
jgi:hypothetical protein